MTSENSEIENAGVFGMNITKSILSLVALGLFSTTIQYQSASASSLVRVVGCTEIEELIDFVAGETGYPPLRSCPKVSVTPDAVLRSIFAKASAHGVEPMAAFIPASAEILLSPNVDVTKLIGRSYLVHELVHASQFNNRVKAPSTCPGLLESEAYLVQATYLRKYGLNEDALAFGLVSVMKSACSQPYNR
ncbi:MAG: hypothetical protein ACU0DI_15355 [Paracoccaceae bacterium]